MQSYPEDWAVRKIKLTDFEGLQNKWLEELVDSSSVPALRYIGIDVNAFFNKDPDIWSSCPAYTEACSIINSFKVVNDAAERAIALMTTFNQSRTTSKNGMQNLIQVVEENRQRIPSKPTKTNLNSYSFKEK